MYVCIYVSSPSGLTGDGTPCTCARGTYDHSFEPTCDCIACPTDGFQCDGRQALPMPMCGPITPLSAASLSSTTCESGQTPKDGSCTFTCADGFLPVNEGVTVCKHNALHETPGWEPAPVPLFPLILCLSSSSHFNLWRPLPSALRLSSTSLLNLW